MSFGVYRPIPQPRLPVLDATKFATAAPPAFPTELLLGPQLSANLYQRETRYDACQGPLKPWYAAFDTPPVAVFPYPGLPIRWSKAEDSWAVYQQPKYQLGALFFPPNPIFPPELFTGKVIRVMVPIPNYLYWTQGFMPNAVITSGGGGGGGSQLEIELMSTRQLFVLP